MNNRKRKLNYYFSYAVGISIVLHLIFLSVHLDLSKYTKLKKQHKQVIKVVLVDKKKNEIKKINSKAKQIVNTAQTRKKENKIDSKFLGKTNQDFERQTIAKNIGSFKKAGLGERDGAKSVQMNVKKAIPKKQTRKKLVSRKRKTKLLLKDLLLTSALKKAIPKLKALRAPKGSKLGDRLKRGPARNNDFIEDIKIGDFTRLNTTEYKYFGFYDRIRRKLEQFWGSSLQKKAKKLQARGGRIPAGENRITSLTVTLDGRGNITDVFIKGTSGIIELDNAAVESFNKAGPFPNPPKGMIRNGQAKIEWGFVVKG